MFAGGIRLETARRPPPIAARRPPPSSKQAAIVRICCGSCVGQPRHDLQPSKAPARAVPALQNGLKSRGVLGRVGAVEKTACHRRAGLCTHASSLSMRKSGNRVPAGTTAAIATGCASRSCGGTITGSRWLYPEPRPRSGPQIRVVGGGRERERAPFRLTDKPSPISLIHHGDKRRVYRHPRSSGHCQS